ncbi:hypothetical protein CHELA20_50187 [Hyphomicrobiales bacterium]|nr:hypothetical protein CHELA41_20184 [Hyphomicrobiales bacterium]CAH1667295.1 hypothetical protein CHELA20_50187 [Hyphomicrobiales bacterium]
MTRTEALKLAPSAPQQSTKSFFGACTQALYFNHVAAQTPIIPPVDGAGQTVINAQPEPRT